MKLRSCRQGDALYLFLEGEIDEHSVSGVRAQCDRLIDANAGAKCAVFNLAGVKFMDSTGIGFLIGRFKKLQKYGMGMYLENGRGLYVNVGLGFVMFPMRLGAWPEITVITLKNKQ